MLEALDQAGLLVRLLPEWERVRSKPQRNSYDRFTVDRHLVETAAAAAASTRQVSRPDLLLLGALQHDLGKGGPATTPPTASLSATLRAPDRVGLLSRVTAALGACGLDIRTAHVSTLGADAVDAFYVVGPNGCPLRDDERRRRVHHEVLAALG